MQKWSRLSEAEKAEIWDRRRQGESLSVIARHIGRDHAVIRAYVNKTGGVQPRPPKQSVRELSMHERDEISRGLSAGDSCHAIAARLRRAPSSISRDVGRNGGRKRYRAIEAERAATQRRRRPKLSKLALSPRLRSEVEARLQLDWSPQQISAWLKVEFAGQPEMQISHETIYLSLYVQSRGTLRKELVKHLRQRHFVRQARKQLPDGRGQIQDRIMISQRPAEVADRAVPGHWEGDLLQGKPTDAIGTLVERTTRYLMLFTLPDGRFGAEAVRERLAETIVRLPESLRRSLTWDQGMEMSQHSRFTIETGVAIYFCDPKSPWQRGTNENTNGLLRQYFPKGRSLARVTQAELDMVADRLNGRPRQTLSWKNPAQKMAELLRQSAAASGATTA
ncbi:MAG TPA: IS30 family transposase [Candidatus Dormibacteraeota bacterium]|nr:IS30 family transposase [Candidatus Dormibacteraeota bacterium]